MLEFMGREPLTAERIREMILDVYHGELSFSDSEELPDHVDQSKIVKSLLDIEYCLADLSLSESSFLLQEDAERWMRKCYYNILSQRLNVAKKELCTELFEWPECFPSKVYYSKALLRGCASLQATQMVALNRAFERNRKSA